MNQMHLNKETQRLSPVRPMLGAAAAQETGKFTWGAWLRWPFPGAWFAAYCLRNIVLEVLVALSLAFLVWLYARSRDQETLDDMPIPVQIILAPGTLGNYELEIDGSSRVPVSFTGPPSRIRELRNQLQRGQVFVPVTLAVPEECLKDSVYHDCLRVEAEAVPVPPGVQAVVSEGRNAIPVKLLKLAERHLPVRLDHTGDVRISQVKLEPATVMVRGPKDVLDRVRFIATQPYTVATPDELASGPDMLLRGQVSLVRELEGRPIQATPPSVTFRFRVHPRQKVYELTDVPVTFLCPPDFPWRPRFDKDRGRISLRVVGPATEEPPAVQAFVDLTRGSFGQGRNLEPVRLQLPRDFQLAQEPPRRVAFVLEPAAGGDD